MIWCVIRKDLVRHIGAEYGDYEHRLFYHTGYGGRDGKNREEFLKKLKQREQHESDVLLDRDSQLLFLIICSYGKENSRLVVVAVRETQG